MLKTFVGVKMVSYAYVKDAQDLRWGNLVGVKVVSCA
jgi:hypothetical protein